MDREKVIKGLEEISDHFFDIYRNDTDSYKCEKAQEYSYVVIDAIAMLKKQEPVEPEIEGGGNNWWMICGECHGLISGTDKFCRHCGRKIKKEKDDSKK